jgi:hypothetical protein
MRVEVVEALPEHDKAVFRSFSDAAVERALKSFLGVMSADDSLFSAEPGGILLATVSSGETVCSGRVWLKFRDEALAANRGTHFSLLAKLSELLKPAGSAESLNALLCMSTGERGGDQAKFALAVVLEATGNSAEQAGLRWGLGLAHIQQALLFTSRALRQQLAEPRN